MRKFVVSHLLAGRPGGATGARSMTSACVRPALDFESYKLLHRLVSTRFVWIGMQASPTSIMLLS